MKTDQESHHHYQLAVIHTEPPVAAVGWNQEDAEALGVEYLTVSNTVQLVSEYH
jgi:pyruvate/2-oxoglutarate dehydrogenase complex dihydrolipoamide dehydrogenase (E3) component